MRINNVVKTTEIFSLQRDAKMASAFAVLLILTFVLKESTCDGVRLANYIPIPFLYISEKIIYKSGRP